MPDEPKIPIQHNPEDGPAWRAAREAGIDMDLLEESLALTPTERLRLHTIAVRRLEILEQAMREGQELGPEAVKELDTLQARAGGPRDEEPDSED